LTSSLSSYLTTASLSNYALTSSLSNYATTASLSNYALTSSLSSYLTTASLSNYLTTSSLNNTTLTGTTTTTNLTINSSPTIMFFGANNGQAPDLKVAQSGITFGRNISGGSSEYDMIVYNPNSPTIGGLRIYCPNSSVSNYTLNYLDVPMLDISSVFIKFAVLPTCATIPTSGSQLINKTYADTNFLTTSSLSNYATTSSLSNYALTSSLSNYATTSSLSNYATTSTLSNYATTSSLSNYAPINNATLTGTTTINNVVIPTGNFIQMGSMQNLNQIQSITSQTTYLAPSQSIFYAPGNYSINGIVTNVTIGYSTTVATNAPEYVFVNYMAGTATVYLPETDLVNRDGTKIIFRLTSISNNSFLIITVYNTSTSLIYRSNNTTQPATSYSLSINNTQVTLICLNKNWYQV
jgi:hypothetical protein